MGLDPLNNERIWHVLYWTLSGGAQVQYASWAISALDTAIWDIKGKALGAPIWKLLGGARDKVQAYATIGVPGADIEQLCEAARRLVAMGFKCLKTQVGRPGLDNLRGQKPMIEIVRNDARRIKALREAVGDEIEIGIDAQCRLDLSHAMELVRLIEPYHVGFFEEPLVQNDVLLMADMRRRSPNADPRRPGRGLGLPLPRHAAARTRSTCCSRTSRSPAASPIACASPASPPPSTCRSTAAAISGTICTCKAAAPPAPRSNTRPRR